MEETATVKILQRDPSLQVDKASVVLFYRCHESIEQKTSKKLDSQGIILTPKQKGRHAMKDIVQKF